MRTLLFAFLLFAFSPNLLADAGSGFLYKVRFFMNDGSRQVGEFEVLGYDLAAGGILPDSMDRDKGIYEVIRQQVKNHNLDSFTFYKKIQYPKYFVANYPTIYPNSPLSNNQLGAVAFEDVVKIALKDVKFTVFIKSEPCKRAWLTSELIIVSQEVIDKLNRKWLTHAVADGSNDSVEFFNYNPKVNEAEILRLHEIKKAEGFKKIPNNQRGSYDYDTFLIDTKDRVIREWFWKKGIVIVYVHGTC